jgi:hypothetical protein
MNVLAAAMIEISRDLKKPNQSGKNGTLPDKGAARSNILLG